MPTYKDKERGTWYCQFRHKDVLGNVKRVTRRGFKLKKDAERYEAEYKLKMDGSCSMIFKDLVDLYLENQKGRVRATTLYNREKTLKRHMIPFFGKLPVNKITPAQVLEWQKGLQDYSDTYQRTLSNTLSAVFNHAIRFYDLLSNPIHKAGHIGKTNAEEMTIWTVEQFTGFIDKSELNIMYNTLFTCLFWSGLRIGEALGLTLGDYDSETKAIRVNKTVVFVGGEMIYHQPKTPKSKREVMIPDFLAKQLDTYISKLYDIKKDDRLFPVPYDNVKYRFYTEIERQGLPKIRLHDLRHSHVSMLLRQGMNIVLISRRLGHENPEITLNIYSHLSEDDHTEAINRLNDLHTNLAKK